MDETRYEEEKGRSGARREIFDWVRMLVWTLAAVFVITNCVIINARVPTGSMEPTVMTNDRLIGLRFAYWFTDPKRGDIILFRYPLDTKKTFIKRIIGLPGETVRIREGMIYINDAKQPLREDYLQEVWEWENDGYLFHVPENCYLVLGDNRNDSEDARFWAEIALDSGAASTAEEASEYSYVKFSQIKGKAAFVFFPSPRLLD